jgi:hypothetical protein
MLSLLDGGSHPAPLVVSDYANTACQEEDSVGARAKWLEKAIPHLVQLITSVPRWTVGLAIDESSWDRYTSGTPESFAKAVVEQHVIHVPCWSANRVRQVVTASLARAMPELEPVFVQVACAGASDALVARLIDAVRTGPGCELGRNDVMGGEVAARQPETHSMEESDPWKSLQERFLFELLEHTSDLAGRFQLNASPGFLFGTQLAEVDLLCADLKIAVEIDGYYHFTGPDSYRRDRRGWRKSCSRFERLCSRASRSLRFWTERKRERERGKCVAIAQSTRAVYCVASAAGRKARRKVRPG